MSLTCRLCSSFSKSWGDMRSGSELTRLRCWPSGGCSSSDLKWSLSPSLVMSPAKLFYRSRVIGSWPGNRLLNLMKNFWAWLLIWAPVHDPMCFSTFFQLLPKSFNPKESANLCRTPLGREILNRPHTIGRALSNLPEVVALTFYEFIVLFLAPPANKVVRTSSVLHT